MAPSTSAKAFGGCAVLLVFCLAAAPAAAQTPSMPRWDVSAQTGLFLNHPGQPPGLDWWDHWMQAANLGISVGRYLTPHVKLEGELTQSTEGDRFVQRGVPVPGYGLYPITSEQSLRTTSASAVVAWQFLENRWAHPFIFAGASLDFEHERIYTPQQLAFGIPGVRGNPPIAAERTEDLGWNTHARGLVGGGAKLYVTPHAFFRTDTRIGLGANDSAHVSFRVGMGVDF